MPDRQRTRQRGHLRPSAHTGLSRKRLQGYSAWKSPLLPLALPQRLTAGAHSRLIKEKSFGISGGCCGVPATQFPRDCERVCLLTVSAVTYHRRFQAQDRCGPPNASASATLEAPRFQATVMSRDAMPITRDRAAANMMAPMASNRSSLKDIV